MSIVKNINSNFVFLISDAFSKNASASSSSSVAESSDCNNQNKSAAKTSSQMLSHARVHVHQNQFQSADWTAALAQAEKNRKQFVPNIVTQSHLQPTSAMIKT